MQKVFTISEVEIKRRIAAFTALLSSLFLCSLALALWSFPDLIFKNLLVSLVIVLLVMVLFCIFRSMTVRFFVNFRKTKIVLSEQCVERKTSHSDEKFVLKDITGIKMLRTTRGDIRDVTVLLKDRTRQFFDGLDNYEEFYKTLVQMSGKQVPVTENIEFMDFDALWFYPVLGVIISSIFFVSLRCFLNLSTSGFTVVQLIIALYLFLLGGYFLLTKPLAVRYGHKQKQSDFWFGFSMIGASGVIALLTFL